MCLWINLTTGDIYDKVQAELEASGFDTECLGGGRIFHDPIKGNVMVYGYSQVSTFWSLYMQIYRPHPQSTFRDTPSLVRLAFLPVCAPSTNYYLFAVEQLMID